MNKKIFQIAIIILALDQISKVLINSFLKLGESIALIPSFFNLTLCYNEGAAWGLFANNKIVIALGSLVAVVMIYHFIFCFKKNTRNNIAFGLVIGGMAGNLIDRVFFGYVRDFLDFYIFNYDFPVFNIADTAIVIGIILLIYAVIKGEDLSENSSNRRKKTS